MYNLNPPPQKEKKKTWQSLDPNGFNGKVYEMFKEVRLILHNVFQKKGNTFQLTLYGQH